VHHWQPNRHGSPVAQAFDPVPLNEVAVRIASRVFELGQPLDEPLPGFTKLFARRQGQTAGLRRERDELRPAVDAAQARATAAEVRVGGGGP